jgi:hypothetical protein
LNYNKPVAFSTNVRHLVNVSKFLIEKSRNLTSYDFSLISHLFIKPRPDPDVFYIRQLHLLSYSNNTEIEC